MMQKFQIWLEGFYYGGDVVTATYLGQMIGYDFRDAVERWYTRHPSPTFDPIMLTEFQCRHYPTEAEARKFAG